MGTRCVTVVTHKWDQGEQVIDASIYRHWDGYLDSHGKWLFEFLNDCVVTNGKEAGPNKFNGPGRLAAGIVHQLVVDGHDPDLQTPGIECGQEYEYHVHVDYGSSGGKISVKVLDGPMTMFGGGGDECHNEIFNGTVKEFGAFIIEATTGFEEATG